MARGFLTRRTFSRQKLLREERETPENILKAAWEAGKQAHQRSGARYPNDKALVDDCVKVLLASADSALVQARGEASGYDGISAEKASQQARLVWAALQRARLFVVHPERWIHLYHKADRFVEEQLCGMEWSPPDAEKVFDEAERERAEKLVKTYEEQGTQWPFPDKMPFDSVFFAYGRRLNLTTSPVALFTRLRQHEWENFGCPDVLLLGHLLAWQGDTPYAFAVLEFVTDRGVAADGVSIKNGSIGFIATYLDGEWFQPASLDPWILDMLVRSVNEHKQILQDYAPTLAHKMDRKKASKQLRQLLPLPAPFYMVQLKDELVTIPQKKTGRAPGRKIEWSHRWDVRGHECVRIERGPLPLDPELRAKLLKRGYNIHDETTPFDTEEGRRKYAEDMYRLAKRGVRVRGPREWMAVLSYWRDAMIKGPAEKPYVPSARVGA